MCAQRRASRLQLVTARHMQEGTGSVQFVCYMQEALVLIRDMQEGSGSVPDFSRTRRCGSVVVWGISRQGGKWRLLYDYLVVSLVVYYVLS